MEQFKLKSIDELDLDFVQQRDGKPEQPSAPAPQQSSLIPEISPPQSTKDRTDISKRPPISLMIRRFISPSVRARTPPAPPTPPMLP